MEYVSVCDATVLADVKPESPAGGFALLSNKKALRVGAFFMDPQATVIRWRGEPLHLSSDQRQTLRVLLQHAGQILSCERLASLLHIATDKVDAHIHSLRTTLESAGVTLVPRRAEGCGYILWR